MQSLHEHPLRAAALDYLLSRIDYERIVHMPYGERAYKLDRMRDLLARLGDPQARLPILHIAGTKGKGSTAAMLASALTAAGHRTGLFSSPHLERIEERFAIDGQPCSGEEFVGLVDSIRPIVEVMDAEALRAAVDIRGPTFFELTTAMALAWFALRKVDLAVLEVGLGGRLDSTNVCEPLVSVITSISFDHTQQLGNTLASIAREKAGIIKPRVPVVSGVLADEPRQVIEDACRDRHSPLVQLGREFDFRYLPPSALQAEPVGGRLDFISHISASHSREGVVLGLLGRHQGANAALALATLDLLAARGWALPEEPLRRGLAEVRWPARIEVVSRRPTVVLDGAHNAASAAALVDTLRESFSARRRVLIFGTTREKDVRGMFAELLPFFDEVVLTQYRKNPRGFDPHELCELADGLPADRRHVTLDPASAWEAARQRSSPEDLVCVTGSLFLAAEMRPFALPEQSGQLTAAAAS